MSQTLVWEEIPGDKICAPLSVAGPYVISHRWNIVPTQEDETRKVWYFPLSYRPSNEHHHVGNFDTLDEAKSAAQKHADELTPNHRGSIVRPDSEGRCGGCGSANFQYDNGNEHAACGTRGYRCMTCGRIKPEDWRTRTW